MEVLWFLYCFRALAGYPPGTTHPKDYKGNLIKAHMLPNKVEKGYKAIFLFGDIINGIISTKLRRYKKYFIYLILVSAFLIRFEGIKFGLPFLYNPNEYLFVNPALHILRTGDLNPHWFGYPGSFIIYLFVVLFGIILAIYLVYCFIFGYVSNLNDFFYLVKNNPIFYYHNNPVLYYFSGRTIMVLFAVITIYLTYLITKRLFNKPMGLLAAFCLSISPLHIQHSRVIRPDITATMLIMFSIYFLVEFVKRNKEKKLLILSSLFASSAIATKYTAGIIIFPILTYCLIADFQQMKYLPREYFFNFLKIDVNLSKALLFIFIGFFIFAPFVILDYRHSIADIVAELRPTHLGHERLPGIQNHIWYLKNVLIEGMGGVLFAIFAGLGLCLILLRKRYKDYLFILFPLLYYICIVCYGRLRWERWLIPILPFEAIFFGVGIYVIYKYCVQKNTKQVFKTITSILFVMMVATASVPTIVKNVHQGIYLSRLDTRTIAKEWIEKNLSLGSKIAYETYAPHLDINPREDFVLINVGFKKIVSQPLSYYKNRGVEYIIITTSFKIRFYNEPNKYSKEISRYEELKKDAELIKVFDNKKNPGPIIELYRLK